MQLQKTIRRKKELEDSAEGTEDPGHFNGISFQRWFEEAKKN